MSEEQKDQQETKTAVELVKRDKSAVTQFDPDNAVALYLDPSIFEQVQRIATMMSRSQLVPKHLQSVYGRDAEGKVVMTENKVSDCFLVCAQAFRWRMDPFSVAQHTFVLSGKLGYEGKLIAALINTNRNLDRRLNYTYEGSGLQRKVTVSGRLKGEDKDRVVSGTIAEWQTQNPKWKDIPDQMLSYRGAREWARRHMPEAVLGVQADEEVEEIALTESPRNGAVARPESLEAVIDETEHPEISAFTRPDSVQAADDAKPEPAREHVVVSTKGEVSSGHGPAPEPPQERKKQPPRKPPLVAPEQVVLTPTSTVTVVRTQGGPVAVARPEPAPEVDPEDAELDKLFS